MYRGGCIPCYSWYVVMALAALLALGGCGDTSVSNPFGGDGSAATATLAPEPTLAHIDGWQTYSDTTYGFIIQYPPDWTAALGPQQGAGVPSEVVKFFATKRGSAGTPPTQDVITITAEASKPNTVDATVPPGFAPNGSVAVGGATETLLSGPGSTGGQGLLVMLALDTQVFVFYSTADDASAAFFRQTFTQMLATFQSARMG